jgi:hypothetical protein
VGRRDCVALVRSVILSAAKNPVEAAPPVILSEAKNPVAASPHVILSEAKNPAAAPPPVILSAAKNLVGAQPPVILSAAKNPAAAPPSVVTLTIAPAESRTVIQTERSEGRISPPALPPSVTMIAARRIQAPPLRPRERGSGGEVLRSRASTLAQTTRNNG